MCEEGFLDTLKVLVLHNTHIRFKLDYMKSFYAVFLNYSRVGIRVDQKDKGR